MCTELEENLPYKKFIEILKELLKSIQIGEGSQEEWQQIKENIELYLHKLQEEGALEMFFLYLREEYCDDRELYKILLRYLCEFAKEDEIIYELLYCMRNDALVNNEDAYYIRQWNQQYVAKGFHLGRHWNIEEDWNMFTYIRERVRQKYNCCHEFIPAEKRDEGFIVVATNQLLGINHAPTKFVFEFCRIIETVLKKKVLLINEVLVTDIEYLQKNGLKLEWIRWNNYLEEATGDFTYEYNGYKVAGYQILLKDNSFSEMEMLVNSIFEKRPYCVWCFGDNLIFSNLCQQFTTLVYTAFNQGYPGVPADIVVNYFKRSSVENLEEKRFLEEHNVKVKDIEFVFDYPVAQGEISREDIGIPQNAFCIGVIGNRLASVCDTAFLEILHNVMCQEEKIYIVFIGGTDEEFEKRVNEQLLYPERICFMGYQKKLQEAVNILDIFVNPIQLGGGTGGILALNEGKPIITAANGDVASFAGEEFICEGLDAYEELILRYSRDKEFYREKSALARQKAEKMCTTDNEMAEIIKGIFDLVAEES